MVSPSKSVNDHLTADDNGHIPDILKEYGIKEK